jgi:4-amino-4-deoxy-L-arabinose transferase-like glycosyltransferase
MKNIIIKRENMFLLLMLVFAIGARIVIANIFSGQSSDEFCNISLIRNTFESGFRTYPELFMWFYYFISALLMFIVNDSLITGIAVTIGFGVASIYILYLITEDVSDKKAALLAVLLLVVNPEFSLIGSVPLKEPVYTFFMLLSLLMVIRGRIFIGAVSVGMAFLTRMEGLLVGMPMYLACLKKKSIFKKLVILAIFVLFVLFMQLWIQKPFEYLTGTYDINKAEMFRSNIFRQGSLSEMVRRIPMSVIRTFQYIYHLIGLNMLFILPGLYALFKLRTEKKGVGKMFIYLFFHLLSLAAYLFIFGKLAYNFHRYLYSTIPLIILLVSAGFVKLLENKKLKPIAITALVLFTLSGYYIYYLDPGRQYFMINRCNAELIKASKWIDTNIRKEKGKYLIDGIPYFYMTRKARPYREIMWNDCYINNKIRPQDKEGLFNFIKRNGIRFVIWQNDNLPAQKLAPYLKGFQRTASEYGGELAPIKQFKKGPFICNIYEFIP